MDKKSPEGRNNASTDKLSCFLTTIDVEKSINVLLLHVAAPVKRVQVEKKQCKAENADSYLHDIELKHIDNWKYYPNQAEND